MAATNYFVSIPNRRMISSDLDDSKYTSGTATTATDLIELRMQTADSGAAATGLTRKDVLMALKSFERWILQGGLLHNGTNLPVL